MATLEQRVTALERNSVTKDELDQKVWQIHAILVSIVDSLARIHRFIQVDGVRTAEGCEGVTGAIIRA